MMNHIFNLDFNKDKNVWKAKYLGTDVDILPKPLEIQLDFKSREQAEKYCDVYANGLDTSGIIEYTVKAKEKKNKPQDPSPAEVPV